MFSTNPTDINKIKGSTLSQTEIKIENEVTDYIEKIKGQLKACNLYIPGDEETMLKDLGRQYHLYLKFMRLSENSLSSKDANSFSVISNRHYQNVLNTIKFLGITPMSRANLKVLETTHVNEDNILDGLNKFLED